MLKLSSKITFNEGQASEIVYTFVNDVKIKSTWSQLTDTAKITIPKNIQLEGKDIAIGTNPVFKRGDTVKIELGYDDNLREVFNGYLTKVFLKKPIELECEDKMYALKKHICPDLSYSSVDVKTLVNALNLPVKYEFNQEQNLGKVRISNKATGAFVLEFLRKEFSIYSFFQDNILRIGRPYYQGTPKNHVFGMEKNVISDSLEFVNSEDAPIKVRAYGIRSSDNKKVEAFYPSEGSPGELHTVKVDNLPTTRDYYNLAKRHYETQQFTGYRGSFTTFGAPLVKHGDSVTLQSEAFPERNTGKYLVKEVDLSFGVNGYRQEIKLDRKL